MTKKEGSKRNEKGANEKGGKEVTFFKGLQFFEVELTHQCTL